MLRLVVASFIFCAALADVTEIVRPGNPNLSTPRPFGGQQGQVFQPTNQIAVLRQEQEIANDGSYRWLYETENGITAQEEARIQILGPEEATKSVTGSFSYTSPEGIPITVTYVADENGFRAEGAHLPTPPPIPEAILRSLEYNAANAPKNLKN